MNEKISTKTCTARAVVEARCLPVLNGASFSLPWAPLCGWGRLGDMPHADINIGLHTSGFEVRSGGLHTAEEI
eukprot:5965761-Prymnesium_polylepis.1